MNKEAYFEGRSPLELLVGSALAGGGGFAAMRLLKEVMDAGRPKQQAGENENSLTIDIPTSKTPKVANEFEQVGLNPFNSEGLMKIIALLGGAPVGFMGAKKLYDTGKEKQMQGEIDRSNQKYLNTLASFNKQSSESNTPAVDAFCEGLANTLDKQGFAEGFSGPDVYQAFPEVAKSIGDVPSDARRAISESIVQNGMGSKLMNAATLGLGDDVGNAWKGVALAAALLGTGGMLAADGKRRKSEQALQFPSTVKINEV